MTSGAGADSLIGGLGTDMVSYASLNVKANQKGVTITQKDYSMVDIDALGQTRMDLADTVVKIKLFRFSVNNFIATDQSDIVDVLQGIEIFTGSAGNDRFIFSADSNYRVDGGAGDDTLEFNTTDSIFVDFIYGSGNLTSIEIVKGGDDYLGAGDDDDLLRGGAGSDTLEGGSGNDLIRGGNDTGVDTFIGGLGDDDLYGGRHRWAKGCVQVY